MIRNKTVTATLLSAGMILGTASAAFALDSTPTATVATTASFNAQVAAYNTSLLAFDNASATFKIQVAAYTTAVQVYKTSYINAPIPLRPRLLSMPF
jgi:hypothetical protein